MAGIYIHIPFCKQACYYCDFHFSTNQDLRTKMVEAIGMEMLLQKNYLEGEAIETIYFGGGTPSLLSYIDLNDLLTGIHTHFKVLDHAEITMEANPDDLTVEKLQELKRSGVNRLSIGIQTFHDSLLTSLNRAHHANAAFACFTEARNAGFDNLSIDLMYALPGETDDMLLQDLGHIKNLRPEHVSCYSLTIEPKTAFGKWVKQGKMQATNDETAARHLEIVMKELGDVGYEHYEISNFSTKGNFAKHNSNYWKDAVYLGLGPSAHSYNKNSRHYTVANNHEYIRSLTKNQIPMEIEILSREDKINEYILTRLRTAWGCECSELVEKYGYDLLTDHADYLLTLVNNKLIEISGKKITLTHKGKLFADKIASDLFIVP
jgi:oxygen-independent coproporphyrinogen III oxidase